ncbi:hypothetical protein, partial [Hydrogenophaga sp.]|uniref:hypothetical protein n=1 Tax=Hydrogenophaga sp. TaxID=1904254 RepID=UPI002737131F
PAFQATAALVFMGLVGRRGGKEGKKALYASARAIAGRVMHDPPAPVFYMEKNCGGRWPGGATRPCPAPFFLMKSALSPCQPGAGSYIFNSGLRPGLRR